jgi:hypothetical protein
MNPGSGLQYWRYAPPGWQLATTLPSAELRNVPAAACGAAAVVTGTAEAVAAGLGDGTGEDGDAAGS